MSMSGMHCAACLLDGGGIIASRGGRLFGMLRRHVLRQDPATSVCSSQECVRPIRTGFTAAPEMMPSVSKILLNH